MKKYLLFLVAAMLATVARAAVGDTFIYEGLKYEVTSEDDHTVAVGENSVSGDISIPSFAVNGSSRYSVTKIGSRAFYSCENLTSVVIPNSVTEIGVYAFENCKSLTSVDIPNSVTTIGKETFSGCSSLTSVDIPNSVTVIGERAFESCYNLTSVTIPNSVTEIGKSAFANCGSLSEIVVENGNPNYISEDGVLFNIDKTELIACPGGKEGEYLIPTSVNKIGEFAFCWCSSLTSVTIPNSVTTIEGTAFDGCESLSEIVVENGNPNYISEDGVLFNIDKTELIACPGGKEGEYLIPTSVNKIGEFAFCCCSSLTSVTIPNTVTEIGYLAFYWCPNLTSVTIPNSVTTIGDSAFYWCFNLKTIYYLNPKPQLVGEEAFQHVPNDVIIYIPKGSYNDYSRSNDWSQFSDFREMGAFDVALSERTLALTPGNTAKVTATVTKDDDMTVKSEEWTTSNPEVATVDNGVITAVAPGEAVIWFTAVDGYGVPHTEACKVTVSDKSGVAEVVTDTDASVDVYNLQGVAVLRNATASTSSVRPRASRKFIIAVR